MSGGTPDQVPWFADLDYYATALIARGKRPEGFKQSDAYLDWHRELGTGFYLQGYRPYKQIAPGCTVTEHTSGNLRHRSVSTPKGKLTETWKWSDSTFSEAPVERLVKSEKDLPAYRCYYEHLQFSPDHDFAYHRKPLVDEIGVILCYVPRTPFMRMVNLDAGIENIVSIWMNDQTQLEATLAVIKDSLDAAVDLVVQGPADIVMIPENLSSEVVGEAFFERYMKNHQADWVKKIHASEKFSCMHLDGTLRGLLKQEAAVGFTFIEGMTPAPAGDLPIEEWPAYLAGTDVIAWGGIPGAFFTDQVSDTEFDNFVIRVLKIMTGEPRYVLGVADQVPPDGMESRIMRVRELVVQYGRYQHV